MRNILFCILIASTMLGCSRKEKTIEYLTTTADKAIENMTRYAVFAADASDEDFYHLYNLFVAKALSEEVCMKNCVRVLEEMSASYVYHEAMFKPAASLENLRFIQEEESYKSKEMYPQFIAGTTKKEAQQIFEYARQSSEKSAAFFQEALAEIETTGSDANISPVWYVCPKCGNISPSIESGGKCPVCGEETRNFTPVK